MLFRSPSRRFRFSAGFLLAVVCLFSLAEGLLRLVPPHDLYPYLGEQSPLTGPYRADPDFGVGYRNWDAFEAENAERLRPYLPLTNHSQRPTWALFGNSFFQAPGMLADHASRRVTDRTIFILRKNERFEVRLAQIKLLLEHGFRPQRIVVEVMPADLLFLGPHPLSTVYVTARGAITYTPRPMLPPVAWLGRHSRLALTALVRAGMHQGNPAFDHRKLYDGIDPTLLGDLQHLFAGLARITREKGVPVTVLLIPAYHQIARGASCHFQDTLVPMLRDLGLDVCDPRGGFLACSDKESLFIPDRHFSDAGNALLLDELLAHLEMSRSEGGLPTVWRAR